MYSGDISFPIYLTHFVGLREFPRWWVYISPSQSPILWDNLILGTIFTILFSDLMHRVVEQPSMKAGNWLIRYLRATVFVPKEKKSVDEKSEEEEEEVPTQNIRRFSQLPESKRESFTMMIKKRKEALEQGDSTQNFDLAGVPNRDRMSMISSQRVSRVLDFSNASGTEEMEPPLVTVHEYSHEEDAPFVISQDPATLEKKPSTLKNPGELSRTPSAKRVVFPSPSGTVPTAYESFDDKLNTDDAFEAAPLETDGKGKRPMSLAEYVATKRSSQAAPMNSSLIDGLIHGEKPNNINPY